MYLLARALGFPDSESGIPSSIIDWTMNDTAALHVVPASFHTPSMLLDVKRGKPIEVEVIVGEVVRMAKEKGVPVPVSVTRLYTRSKLITTFSKRVEMLYALLIVVQNQILRNLELGKK